MTPKSSADADSRKQAGVRREDDAQGSAGITPQPAGETLTGDSERASSHVSPNASPAPDEPLRKAAEELVDAFDDDDGDHELSWGVIRAKLNALRIALAKGSAMSGRKVVRSQDLQALNRFLDGVRGDIGVPVTADDMRRLRLLRTEYNNLWNDLNRIWDRISLEWRASDGRVPQSAILAMEEMIIGRWQDGVRQSEVGTVPSGKETPSRAGSEPTVTDHPATQKEGTER